MKETGGDQPRGMPLVRGVVLCSLALRHHVHPVQRHCNTQQRSVINLSRQKAREQLPPCAGIYAGGLASGGQRGGDGSGPATH